MLRESVPVLEGEVVDATVMRVGPLREFLTAQIARAKADDVLFSVHLKATMMKVSDPIIFGHVVRAFFPALFTEHAEALAAAGVSPNDGLGALLKAVQKLPDDQREAIEAAVKQGLDDGPKLAMVDSDNGITNLHVPERRDRRRLDARDDPHLRPHVGPRRRRGRHPRGDPRLVVRRDLPGRHRRLPGPRRLRPARRWARWPTSG